MNFDFLAEAIKQHPKILDNLGIINFIFEDGSIERLGILVTKENGDLYLSLVL